jgi:hypothetical protein
LPTSLVEIFLAHSLSPIPSFRAAACARASAFEEA